MKVTNPTFNYDAYGQEYSGQRKTDPRIAAYVYQALGDAKTVLNVGAGAGSYEPDDRYVIALEPSVVMRSQRGKNDKVPAVIGVAEAIPFDDDAFDAAMAMVTIHQWPDIKKGLQEIRRVTKNQIVILTFDRDKLADLWLADYFPELVEVDAQRMPSIDLIKDATGGRCVVETIPVPWDCIDGFNEAYYGRPEFFLNEKVRAAQSIWGFISKEREREIVEKLAGDLQSGEWDKKYGHLRTQPNFTGALTLVIIYP